MERASSMMSILGRFLWQVPIKGTMPVAVSQGCRGVGKSFQHPVWSLVHSPRVRAAGAPVSSQCDHGTERRSKTSQYLGYLLGRAREAFPTLLVTVKSLWCCETPLFLASPGIRRTSHLFCQVPANSVVCSRNGAFRDKSVFMTHVRMMQIQFYPHVAFRNNWAFRQRKNIGNVAPEIWT